MRWKTYIYSLILGSLLLAPSLAFANELTQPQINAIIILLRSFGVSEVTVASIQKELAPKQLAVAIIVTKPNYTVFGTDRWGNTVYDGTGLFEIDPITGCHTSVLRNPLRDTHAVIWCP